MRIRSDIPSRGGQSKRDTEGLDRWGPCIVPPSLRLRVHRLSHPVHERTHPNPRSHASSIPHRLDELPWHQQKGVSSGRPISHSRAGSPVQQHGPTGTGVSQEAPHLAVGILANMADVQWDPILGMDPVPDQSHTVRPSMGPSCQRANAVRFPTGTKHIKTAPGIQIESSQEKAPPKRGSPTILNLGSNYSGSMGVTTTAIRSATAG